jgi:hypothetical protein
VKPSTRRHSTPNRELRSVSGEDPDIRGGLRRLPQHLAAGLGALDLISGSTSVGAVRWPSQDSEERRFIALISAKFQFHFGPRNCAWLGWRGQHRARSALEDFQW